MAICAVYGCNTSNDKFRKNNEDGACKHKLFRFPKDPKMAKIWQLKCGRSDNVNPRTAYICSKHFTKDHYVRNLQYELLNYWPKTARHLKGDAVPTEELPSSAKRKKDVKRLARAQKTSYHTLSESLINESSSMGFHSVEFLDEDEIENGSSEIGGLEKLEEKPSTNSQDSTRESTDKTEDEDYQIEMVFLDECSRYINEAENEETNMHDQGLGEISAATEDSLPIARKRTNRKRKSTMGKRKFKIMRETCDDSTDEDEVQIISEELSSKAADEMDIEELILLPSAKQNESTKEIGRVQERSEQIKAKSKEQKDQHKEHVSDHMPEEEHPRSTENSHLLNVEQEPISMRKKRSPKRDYGALIESLLKPKPISTEVKRSTPNAEELMERITKQEELIKTLQDKNYLLNHQVLKLTHENFMLQKEFDAFDKIFSPTQRKKMRLGARVQWTPDDISKCVEIYRQSPRAYKFLLGKGYPFLAVTTIMKHLAKVKAQSTQVGSEHFPEAMVDGQVGVTDQELVTDEVDVNGANS